MSRHAYLIIAHNKPEVLRQLIASIDDERNDIFVHIDAKAGFDGKELTARRSRLYLLSDRIDARWGDYSLVEVEFALLKAARKSGEHYAYFHLLSGVDLPIKSPDYIHDYCLAHPGTIYIGISPNATKEELAWRSQHYFLFSRRFKSNSILLRTMRRLAVLLQDICRYHRYPNELRKGSQWWSITEDFADYALAHEAEARRYFRGTYCPDEMVFQTLCWNSPFRERLYSHTDEFEGCKRYIKWENGRLLPITADDIADMQASSRWFARKFDKIPSWLPLPSSNE